MKKVLLTAAAAIATLAALSCGGKNEGYVIDGSVTGQNSGTVYLRLCTDKAYIDVDSTDIVEGKFHFEGLCRESAAYVVVTDKDAKRPPVFFLENAKMKISINAANSIMTITGSPLSQEYLALAPKVKKPSFSIDSLANAQNASVITPYIIMSSFAHKLELDDLKDVRGKLAPELDGTFYVRQIDALIDRLDHLKVGEVAPDFTLPDVDGNPVSLSSFRGQYVLVDFWASWCPDCRNENPNVVKAYRQFHDWAKKNFTVLGVSLDKLREPWVNAIKFDELNWTHVSDLKGWDNAAAQLYAIKWIPTSYLIDPDGVILAVGLEGKDLIAKLREVL